MTSHIVVRGLLVTILAAGPLTSATAQSFESPASVTTGSTVVGAEREAPDEWIFTVGGGLGIAPDYEGSEDYKIVPIPFLQANKRYYEVQLVGLHLRSNLIDHPNWRLGPSANFRQGYSRVDNNRVDDLNNRGNSFELGLKGGYEYLFDGSSVGGFVEFLHDVSDGHDGYVITPSLEYQAPLAPAWDVLLNTNFSYASGDYMSHYFSVNQSDAQDSGLRQFDADADVKDVTFALGFIYSLTKAWKVTMVGQYKRLVGDAEDSPVVDDVGDENNFFGGFVVTYSW